MRIQRKTFHRNLHHAAHNRNHPELPRKDEWAETKGGKVLRYVRTLLLLNVTSRIQPAGARKCREEGVRRVCAYLVGEDWDEGPRGDLPAEGWIRVKFDPRVHTDFMADGKPWRYAEAVSMGEDGVTHVYGPVKR